MLTGLVLMVVVIALLSHSVLYRPPRADKAPQTVSRVVRICSYCNLIMGVHSKALKHGQMEKEAGHAPSGPGLILTHGMCQSCFADQMRELDEEP